MDYKKIGLILIVLFLCSLVNALPTDGLVIHYPFDGNFNDLTMPDNSSKDGIYAGLTSDILFVEGVHGNAIKLNGKNTISVPVNPSAGYSISGWIKFLSPSTSNLSMDIWGDEYNYKGCGFQIIRGELYTVSSGGGMFRAGVGYYPQSNVWYHIVQVFDSGSIKTYINGILYGNHNRTLSAGEIQFRLGHSSNGSFNLQDFNGLIDEFKIYSTSLTESDVNSLYLNESLRYISPPFEDIGQCQRGIERLLQNGTWEIIRQPVFASSEDNNYFACHDGIDNDCDGFTDSADLNCVFDISDVNFSPSVPKTMQDINISFNVNNPNGNSVNCIIKETSVSQTLTGNYPKFNLNLGVFGSGSYMFDLFCSNGSLFEEKVYPFEVSALPDLAIDSIMANSNPEVGENLEITSEIRNNGGTNFSNVPIELVYTDLNGDIVNREIQNIDVGRNSSEVVVFHKIISTMGWKILEINIDPANIIEEEYEFNNTSGKLIYGGLFDPSNSSARINVDSTVYPNKRSITGPGFLFVGKATYEIDGSNTNYPVAGAQIDITIDSNITTDASPLAELRDWTQSDGNFVIPFENPRVLADYKALIEITDGTAYGSSVENFIVDQNAGLIDYNTPWGDWNYDGNGFTPSPDGNRGNSGSGGINPGPGGFYNGGGIDCNKANLTSSISVNYPNIEFSIGGYDARNPEDSIANKSYTIIITLNNTAISLSRTGVLNEVVYSGILNDSMLPQTASIYVDFGNDINECNEYDNYSKVDLKGPNIKAKSINAVSLNRKKLLQGEVTRFTLVMQNTGSTVLNNVPVTFSIDGNIFRSYTINSIAPNQTNTYTFDDVLNNYGLTRFTLESSFVDSDMNDNRFSKLFKVLIPDYYVRSFEDGPLIIVNPNYPTIGQRVDINATVKSNDRISRDASVPVELFADGALVNASSVLFPNGKNFAFAQIGDYVAPMLAKTVSMGIYVNRELRQYEENSMNNYVTFSLFVKGNPLIDANVSLLKYIDLVSLTPIADKVLNTKFSSESSVLDQIKTFVNNSANLSANTSGVYRIRVDVNNESYFSNYFLVEDFGGGDVVIPDCEFNADWNSFKQNPLQFNWSHSVESKMYYVAIDMWTTGNSSPLGDIEQTIERVKQDYAWSQETGMEFRLPQHIYEYEKGIGELFYGGSWDYPFTFKIKAYLLDENFDLIKLIDEKEIILECGTCSNEEVCENNFCVPSPIIQSCWNEETNPHPICSLSDLNKVREDLTANYVLMNDIDASETINWNGGNGWTPIGECGPNNECNSYSSTVTETQIYTFQGNINGNNHVISDLTINLDLNNPHNYTSIGLFGVTTGNIQNIGLNKVNITLSNSSYTHLGGLVGIQRKGLIENCYSTNTNIVGNDRVSTIGGLVGSQYGIIKDSYSSGNISGFENIGGLIGWTVEGELTNSYSTANVESNRGSIGGLIGIKNDVNITNCYATGDVHVNIIDPNSRLSISSAGGLIGRIQDIHDSSSVNNSYATGNISIPIKIINNEQIFSPSATGGLIGGIAGTINNSYSTGNVNAPSSIGGVGGFSGGNGGIINNSYSTGNVTGSGKVGGFSGSSYGTINNSYSTGNIDSNGDYTGGLIGYLQTGEIKNSYSKGNITSTSTTGGLIGYNNEGKVTNSYWDKTISNKENMCGKERNTICLNENGKITLEMKDINTFVGWDFVNIWVLKENNYPLLSWQVPTSVVDWSCPIDYDPVCGVDGVTYRNACYAEFEGEVAVDYNGEC